MTMRRISRESSTLQISEWEDCAVVLQLPDRPQSLRYRAYARKVEGETLLAWVLRRLGVATRHRASLYLNCSRWEADRVRRVLPRGESVGLVTRSSHIHAKDLLQICETSRRRTVLLIDLAGTLLPMSALEDLLCHHAGAKNPVTRFKGAPCEPPVLITADALAFLAAEVPIGARLSKVLQSLEALSNAPGVTAPLPVAWYAPVTEGEREQRKWPYRLDLDLPQDVT